MRDAIDPARAVAPSDQAARLVACARRAAREACARCAVVGHTPSFNLALRLTHQLVAPSVAAAAEHHHFIKALAAGDVVAVIGHERLAGDQAQHGVEALTAGCHRHVVARARRVCRGCAGGACVNHCGRSTRMAAAIFFITPDTVQAREQSGRAGRGERGRQTQFIHALVQPEQMDPLAQAARQGGDIDEINLPGAMDDADALLGWLFGGRQIVACEGAREAGRQPRGDGLGLPQRRQIKCALALAARERAAGERQQQAAAVDGGDADGAFRVLVVNRAAGVYAVLACKRGVARQGFLDRAVERLAGAQRAFDALAGEVGRARQAQGQMRAQVRLIRSGGARAMPVGRFKPAPQRAGVAEGGALGLGQRQRLAGVAPRVVGVDLDPVRTHCFENL